MVGTYKQADCIQKASESNARRTGTDRPCYTES